MAQSNLEESRAKSLHLWDEMAPGWEKRIDYMSSVTHRVSEWLVDRLDPQPGDVVLDIAAGPGETGFLAARRIEPEGRLISTDFAPDMVEVAKRRAADLGIKNADFRVMDAERMDLESDSVDGALCRWGFMLMLDPRAAFAETRRVLRDGGKFAFSVWGPPDVNPWVTVIGMVMTQQGYPPQSDPFGPGGMFSLAKTDTLREALTQAGFPQIDIEEMEVHWRFGSFDEVWGFFTELAGAVATLIKQLDAEKVEKLRAAAEEACKYYEIDDGFVFPGMTINVLCS